ncbi:PREDICTED: peptidyl-prolyl cis-trans isomerase FKBP2 [Pseudopodoces humilis]|uniref:peptidyl-prolyl cis-trans isomerase FKBP2 n=1 Tax=Pseudopodoces humilis TaxID=181119 RepID=UPI0006B78619|nr:PREDICTED: peptidyl-prolyl cis-trans isomerase FKBP2 [Pseudopodoces humilis]
MAAEWLLLALALALPPVSAEPRRLQIGWLLLALALALPPVSAEPRRLQIGVRKRPQRCPERSRRGDLLSLLYSGTLEDGTPFDSSLSPEQPFVFSLGTGQVIKGWDQGLLGFLGGAVLIFEVELLKIERRPEL